MLKLQQWEEIPNDILTDWYMHEGIANLGKFSSFFPNEANLGN
jgi:hypothetical protein